MKPPTSLVIIGSLHVHSFSIQSRALRLLASIPSSWSLSGSSSQVQLWKRWSSIFWVAVGVVKYELVEKNLAWNLKTMIPKKGISSWKNVCFMLFCIFCGSSTLETLRLERDSCCRISFSNAKEQSSSADPRSACKETSLVFSRSYAAWDGSQMYKMSSEWFQDSHCFCYTSSCNS